MGCLIFLKCHSSYCKPYSIRSKVHEKIKSKIHTQTFLLLVLIIILMFLGCPNETASVGGADDGATPRIYVGDNNNNRIVRIDDMSGSG